MPSSTRSGSRGKPATRRTLISRRDALTASERADAGERIAEAAFAYLEARLATGSATTLGLYAAKGSEVATASLDQRARAAGWTVAYPRVVAEERILAFHEIGDPASELVVGRFGLREPHPETSRLPLAAVSAFVVPGLAFDLGGGRIGWGHGYYDSTLAAAGEALRLGLAFACQIVDEVPREPHDALVHVVITELATHVIG